MQIELLMAVVGLSLTAGFITGYEWRASPIRISRKRRREAIRRAARGYPNRSRARD